MYLTTEELAERWRVSEQTVRAMLRRGTLAAIKVGRSYRVRVVDVEAYESNPAPVKSGFGPAPVVRRVTI